MFLVAGGPGQGSAGAFDLGEPENAEYMRQLLPGYTLVAFDNRGTGRSGLISCPGLQATLIGTAEQFAALARDCATIIGPTREFYATRDHAEDVEAVRRALGFKQIGLFGVSYGTKLSLAYALAHPTAVERLLLDSVVEPSYPDPFYRNVLHELPDVLRQFCAGSRCRGATSDFAGDVVALANQLEARPVQGRVIAPGGALRMVRMTGEDLIWLLIDADLSPGLAASAPAVVRAARSGNTRPLLRLFDLHLRTAQIPTDDLSFGLNAATNCADGGFPWAPSTPPAERRAAIEAAIAQLPPGSFGAFGDWAARLGTAFFCEQWPAPAGTAPLGAGPLPNVPVLAVNGGFDIRTPTANAVAVVSRFPQGRLVVVPGVGHSVLTGDFSFCSQRAVRTWILGGELPARQTCARVAPLAKILGAFPRRPAKKTARATLQMAAKTAREAQATWLELLFSSSAFTPRGLYGGRLIGGSDSFRLTRYALAPGVFLTGRFELVATGPPFTYLGTARVSGPAAVAGTLRFAGNYVSGTLGGRRVRISY
jgi:pimeloyl-ACP methyl ester carboxylesterase